MDKLYNNEALLSCCILQMLKFGPMDYARLALCLPLAVDDRIRTVLDDSRGDIDSFMEELRNNSNLFLNRKYLEYQPSILNSLVLLSQSGMIDYDENKLFLVSTNNDVLESIINAESIRLHQICESITALVQMINAISNQELYSELNIQL